jgi:hypothetical protein
MRCPAITGYTPDGRPDRCYAIKAPGSTYCNQHIFQCRAEKCTGRTDTPDGTCETHTAAIRAVQAISALATAAHGEEAKERARRITQVG